MIIIEAKQLETPFLYIHTAACGEVWEPAAYLGICIWLILSW